MTIDKNLVAHLRQILPDILAETGVTLAYLYGSMATGLALPTSDVDIALVVDRPHDDPLFAPKARMRLEFAVEDALARQSILNPDVRVIDDLPLNLRGQVATQGIRLYARNEAARVEFETGTWKEYLDFEPTARMLREAFFEQVRTRGLLSKERRP